jgi:hypothetical protein
MVISTSLKFYIHSSIGVQCTSDLKARKEICFARHCFLYIDPTKHCNHYIITHIFAIHSFFTDKHLVLNILAPQLIMKRNYIHYCMETLFSLNITGYQQGSPSAFVNI